MSAYGPTIPQDVGYFVEEIRDGLYWVTEGAYQVMFLTTGEGVIVLDAPPSIGEKILQAVADVTDEPITHVVHSQEQGFGNAWNLFDVYLDAVAEKTTELTLAKWEGRLGGADIWTKDHDQQILLASAGFFLTQTTHSYSTRWRSAPDKNKFNHCLIFRDGQPSPGHSH